ncbi:adenylate kinase [Propionimicrobium lymphophilum ACS-093-V-SCH5]|uniref:Adenylate kinase n=2 Tax=Propionimicrobium TaxID=203133 RepID=S2W1I5_9ACTN|nr:adenylate kinase [Propionimicrobium lymphophilum ACS-093-V-SCH5]
MGAPGAGKGTQADGIANRYDVPAISTGDIFRANVKNQTPLGKQVKAIMDAGDYVPDELTESIVFDRLEAPDASAGFLLDGFPRTMHQVDALDDYLEKHNLGLDAVVVLDVDDETLIERLLKRAEIEGRSDDNEETIRNRMKVYNTSTAPLLDHYKQLGLVLAINGEGTVEEISERIHNALDKLDK